VQYYLENKGWVKTWGDGKGSHKDEKELLESLGIVVGKYDETDTYYNSNKKCTDNTWKFMPGMDYTYRLEGYLRSGWMILTEIDFKGQGPVTKDGYQNDTDHFVIIDGVKYCWEDNYDETGKWMSTSLESYIHVVCSVKGTYWIKQRELLRKYGAVGWIMVRKEVC